ncbi:peptidase S49 [Devosia chinhatensis]|uniref:Peptidase S49 n=2 Tax=Devosia chinhatensis TaxID=429727 RepID=A0A0F5FNR1_9HYPH|nr:peptidase S49 [Devosia chinhatensis]
MPKRNWLSRVFKRPTTIPVVRLQGVIAADQRPGRLNIASVEPLLARAFAMKSAPAVAIVVNSPGGSPVQSRLISKRIRDLADENGKPVLVFVEDAAASGGYFIAVAGDEILVDPSSIVGSIGVIMAGFGFVGAIEKLGIERRVHTAGRNKSTLDPFLPEKAEDVERIKQFELDIHEVFIDHVKDGRRGRLKAEDDILFTGQWWTGLRGIELGLVDGVGDLQGTLRERFGKQIVLKHIAPKRPLFALPRLGLSAGAMVEDVTHSIEDRAWWARLGL